MSTTVSMSEGKIGDTFDEIVDFPPPPMPIGGLRRTRSCSKSMPCTGNCGSTRCWHTNKTCDGYMRCTGEEPCTSELCFKLGFIPPADYCMMSMDDAFAAIHTNNEKKKIST